MNTQNQKVNLLENTDNLDLIPSIESIEKAIVLVSEEKGFEIIFHGRITSGWEQIAPWYMHLRPFKNTLARLVCTTIYDHVVINMHTEVAAPQPNIASLVIPIRAFACNGLECSRMLQAEIFQPIRNSIWGSLGLQSPCLLNLPNKVKVIICKFLRPVDLAALSLTCRIFHSICSQQMSLFLKARQRPINLYDELNDFGFSRMCIADD